MKNRAWTACALACAAALLASSEAAAQQNIGVSAVPKGYHGLTYVFEEA